MVIKASAAAEIRSLVAALDEPDGVRREAAIARLGVIGARAVDRLHAAYPPAAPSTRTAILRALEPIVHPRVLALASRAVDESGTEEAAAAVLRRLMDATSAETASAALDVLVAAAVRTGAAVATRRAAREVLRDAPGDVPARMATATGEPGPASVLAAPSPPTRPARVKAPPAAAPERLWEDLAAGRLSGTPEQWIPALAVEPHPPLAALQRLIDAVRVREDRDGDAPAAWQTLRGRAHQALASRGSRLALYDLRESLIAASGPLPVSFLAALQAVGDGSCLEPLAQAWSQADPGEEWWRHQLRATFRTIMQREKLTKRSAVVKRVEKKWPGTLGIGAGRA
jgi:hypothetical protein